MKSTKNSPNARLAKGAIFTAVAAVLASSAANADFIKLNSLSIAAGGTLNMSGASETVAAAASHGLIVQAAANPAHLTNVTNIAGWLTLGYNGGDWLGTGITSPTVAVDAGVNGVLAVMLFDNTLLNYAKWGGAIDLDTIPDANFHQTLARITYAGDFTGDGQVTADDYGLQDFYLSSSLFAQGDLNGDGIIDASDYGLMDYVLSFQPYGNLGDLAAFSGGGGKGGGLVPEPNSVALLLTGAVSLLGMRKRKQSA